MMNTRLVDLHLAQKFTSVKKFKGHGVLMLPNIFGRIFCWLLDSISNHPSGKLWKNFSNLRMIGTRNHRPIKRDFVRKMDKTSTDIGKVFVIFHMLRVDIGNNGNNRI